MEKYIIEGGNPLEGTVEISGAKNSALGLLAASILGNSPSILHNIPQITDIAYLLEAMKSIGVEIKQSTKDIHTYQIQPKHINPYAFIDYDYIKKMRASYYLLGALLGKYKQATIALPGGCDIGSRPMDLHLKGLKLLGATIELKHGFIEAKAKELYGASIYLDFPSVGATINLMLAAVLAKGTTTIFQAAKEPHVVDIANFLNKMGAKIIGAGTEKLVIYGVNKLHGCEYTTIPDQIEAGTFMVGTAITKGSVLIKNVIPKHLECITYKLREMGVVVLEHEDSIQVITKEPLQSIQIITNPYPGFPTDMQPQFAVACGLANGTSIIEETIFEKRFKYADELARMGAKIRVSKQFAVIQGIPYYEGTEICLPDLRAGAALVFAALAAKGTSELEQIHYVQRGYENFEEKIQSLGGKIHKTKLIEGTKLQLIL